MRSRHPTRHARSSTTARSRLLAGCTLALTTAAPSLAPAAPPVDEIAETRRVCAEGPAAALVRAERLRGEAAVTAAGVLPNPSLAVAHQRTLSGPSEQETIVALSVPLGLGGRRRLGGW